MQDLVSLLVWFSKISPLKTVPGNQQYYRTTCSEVSGIIHSLKEEIGKKNLRIEKERHLEQNMF